MSAVGCLPKYRMSRFVFSGNRNTSLEANQVKLGCSGMRSGYTKPEDPRFLGTTTSLLGLKIHLQSIHPQSPWLVAYGESLMVG